MGLIKYIIRRILFSIVMFVGVISAVWFFIELIPGDPITSLVVRLSSSGNYTPAEIEILRQQYMHDFGLDKPWFVQLYDFFTGIFVGKWGNSLSQEYFGTDVFNLIKVYFPRTIEIAIFPLILVNLVAVKSGKYSAVHRGKVGDHTLRGISIMMISLPAFWVAMLMQYAFREIIPKMSFGLFDIPVVGLYSLKYIGETVPFITGFRTIDTLLANRVDLFLDTLLHLIVPTLVYFISVYGNMFRFSRSCMLDVLEQDYIRTARSKGLPEKEVINKHAFRNALVIYSTFIAFNIGAFITGAAYIELIFDFHGLGKAIVTAFLTSDYFMIRGIIVIFCIINITIYLLVDIMYAILDPRITYK